ncbi:22099_t:CDS:2, partial [Gigaspora margarita]
QEHEVKHYKKMMKFYQFHQRRRFRHAFNETIKILLAVADYIEKLTAICQVCQKKASFIQRIIGKPAYYHDLLI